MFVGDEDEELGLISVGIDGRHGPSEVSGTLTREYVRVLMCRDNDCHDDQSEDF
jgi:hypothetical protein